VIPGSGAPRKPGSAAGEQSLVCESIVVISEIPVMFVAGDRTWPIAEQAPVAFAKLEGKLATLRGRRFYGVVVDGQYRACVAIRPEDHTDALPHPTWIIPGGRFARRKLPHWEQHPSSDRTHDAANARSGRSRHFALLHRILSQSARTAPHGARALIQS
jgi:hypothetical protein